MLQSPRSRAATAALMATALIVAGCSKPAAGSQGGAPGAGSASSGGSDMAAGAVPKACGKEINAADVADLLGPSGVTEKDSSTNPELCEFDAGPMKSVNILLRGGDEVQSSWDMTANLNHGRMTPLSGVGDTALMTPEGSEVMSRKGQLLCQVDVIGVDDMLAHFGGDKTALARRLGAICAKIFAARGA